jgi:phage tail-like protein
VFFVRRDSSRLTESDLERGSVIWKIGFAPLHPAEFVIFRIGQDVGGRRALPRARSNDMPETDPRDYPVPNFTFVLQLDGRSVASFSEVTGLDAETEVIEHHEGALNSAPVKLPGAQMCERITLKRGVAHDAELQHWVEAALQGEAEKRSGVIELSNESGEAVVTWHLQGMWPTKITGPSLNARGSELAIEALELSVEGLSIG